MRPLLDAHADGKEHLNRDLVAQLAEQFALTEDERREILPSRCITGPESAEGHFHHDFDIQCRRHRVCFTDRDQDNPH